MAEEHHHDARDQQDSLRCLLAEWRVGRKVPRNIYAVINPEDDADNDVLIGQMDTGQLALECVYRHNDERAKRERAKKRARPSS